jgi:hypothetical protein
LSFSAIFHQLSFDFAKKEKGKRRKEKGERRKSEGAKSGEYGDEVPVSFD